ncbi:MAG: hypothetical protein ACE5FL_12510 [Myxococcota bacterium]
MKPRMLCTDCGRTGEADTLLEGSDVVELVGWCCLALPGLAYCWWRHALRIKVCAFCGGRELIRETRAARQRELPQAPPSGGSQVRNLFGPVLWPRGLATPRERLRRGGVVAALAGALITSLAAAPLGLASAEASWAAVLWLGVASTGWSAYQGIRVAQLRAAESRCRAWDRDGRPLRIELMA